MVERIIEQIMNKAKTYPKKIVFPEGEDDRILQAIAQIKQEKIAIPIVLGDYDKIRWRAGELHLNFDEIEIINPENSDKLDSYIDTFYELRKNKGIDYEQAKETMKDYSYFATMMVHLNDADGLVSGASHSTANTLRPALQIIKTKEGHNIASSYFIMVIEDKTYFFADCAFVVNPNVEQLSEIAISTSESVKQYGIEPKVAMLSFSTHGSGKDESVNKVIDATNLIRHKRPDLKIDGEIQLDAAIIKDIAQKKCPNSSIQGDANILIFPDLNSGNIGYKLVERMGHASAIGPIVQGLNKPVNDLSRGCSVKDIVEVCAITVVEAQAENKIHIPTAIENKK